MVLRFEVSAFSLVSNYIHFTLAHLVVIVINSFVKKSAEFYIAGNSLQHVSIYRYVHWVPSQVATSIYTFDFRLIWQARHLL